MHVLTRTAIITALKLVIITILLLKFVKFDVAYSVNEIWRFQWCIAGTRQS
jgi:hypothetical protein